MALTEKQRILLETNAAREKAEALLHGLMDAKRQTETQLASLKRADAYKTVTGRSAIDNAIVSTKRLVESLNRAVAQARRESDEDLDLSDFRYPGASARHARSGVS